MHDILIGAGKDFRRRYAHRARYGCHYMAPVCLYGSIDKMIGSGSIHQVDAGSFYLIINATPPANFRINFLEIRKDRVLHGVKIYTIRQLYAKQCKIRAKMMHMEVAI